MLKTFQSTIKKNRFASIFKIAAALIISITFGSCSKDNNNTYPDFSQEIVSLSTHQLTAYKSFHNSNYLVILESGLGDNHSIWNTHRLAEKIAQKSDVVLYDRAGYGNSGSGINPRNINQLRLELESIVNHFSNGRKVILIGHSLGGLIIRDFAIKNPTKTAGLLFIDPTHEQYNNPTQELEDELFSIFNSNFGPNFGGTLEVQQLIEDLQYCSNLPVLPDVPTIVLTSMKHDSTNNYSDAIYNSTREVWFQSHETLGNNLTDFTHIGTVKSGHYIMREEPTLFLNNFNLLLSKLNP